MGRLNKSSAPARILTMQASKHDPAVLSRMIAAILAAAFGVLVASCGGPASTRPSGLTDQHDRAKLIIADFEKPTDESLRWESSTEDSVSAIAPAVPLEKQPTTTGPATAPGEHRFGETPVLSRSSV